MALQFTSYSPVYSSGISITLNLPAYTILDKCVVLLVFGCKPTTANVAPVISIPDCNNQSWSLIGSYWSNRFASSKGNDYGNTQIQVYKLVFDSTGISLPASIDVTLSGNNVLWAISGYISDSTWSTNADTSDITVQIDLEQITYLSSTGTTYKSIPVSTYPKTNNLSLLFYCIPTDVTGYSAEYLYPAAGTYDAFATTTELYEPSSSLNQDIGGLVCSFFITDDFTQTPTFRFSHPTSGYNYTYGYGPLALITCSVDAALPPSSLEADLELWDATISGTYVAPPTSLTADFELWTADLEGSHVIAPGTVSGTLEYWSATLDGTFTPPEGHATVDAEMTLWSFEAFAGGTVTGTSELWTCTMYAGGKGDDNAFELWNCEIWGNEPAPNEDAANKYVNRLSNTWYGTVGWDYEPVYGVNGSFEKFTADIQATFVEVPRITAEFEPWDGVFSPPAYIEGSFQEWNGHMEGDLASISATMELWSCTVEGEYAFNSILADMPKWTADMRAGGSINGSFKMITECEIECFVGQVLGISAYFAKFTGVSYAGAAATGMSLQPMTAEITGHVTHVNRISSALPLWGMTGKMHIEGSGDIDDAFDVWNSDIIGAVENPATIKGSFVLWGCSVRASQFSQSSLEGSFLSFTGQVVAHDSTPGAIDCELPIWTALLGQRFTCAKSTDTLNKTLAFEETF